MVMRATRTFRLTGGAWQRPPVLLGLLSAANVAAWGWALYAFADRPTLLGTVLLAWVFGLRHAVDADHIAAIDNVVRKLMQDGRRPVAAGLFFALGHSTVVVLASLAAAAAAAAMPDRLESFKAIGSVIGTLVSAAFLLLIGLVNLLILRGMWRSLRRVAGGGALDADALLTGSGPLARLCRPAFRAITRSWQMYPLGFLFGLGFDTATEIGLLGIAAAQAAHGLSPWQILVFPALFAAGMALVDTADSALMVGAYGWALLQPVRKLWYNFVITAASVLLALLIGGIEALGLLADQFGFEGGVWSIVSDLDDDLAGIGFAVIGIFLFAWGVSAIVYRCQGYRRLAPAGAAGK